jgi:hypothetical protein
MKTQMRAVISFAKALNRDGLADKKAQIALHKWIQLVDVAEAAVLSS